MYTDKQSPWGRIQSCHCITEGIWTVVTAGHGGLKLDRKRNSLIPVFLRAKGGWYEEDCHYPAIICVLVDMYGHTPLGMAVKAAYADNQLECCKKIFRDYYPDEYARFYNVAIETLKGQSYTYDQKLFNENHKDDFVVTAAWGSGQNWQGHIVPEGMVGVVARRQSEEKTFLVTDEEYAQREQFGFVIEERHKEWFSPIQR